MAIGVVLLFVALLGSQTLLGENAQAASKSISGSWVINITPEDPPVPPFTNLSAFTKDGLVISSNQEGLVSIGVWEKRSNYTYQASFQGFEGSGEEAIRYEVRSIIKLNKTKEQFSGPFITDIYTLEGDFLFKISGTIKGDRMHVAPLE